MTRRGAQTMGEAFARALQRARRDGDCLLLGPTDRLVPVRVAGRLHGAHRISFMAINGGPPPADRPLVLHSCHRENCIAPWHLEAGTPARNSRMMVEAGRSARGSRHPRARLTEEAVREARLRAASGVTITELARAHALSRTAMGLAVHRRTWQHVQP